MPITTKQLSTDVAKVPEFTYGGGTVNISYAPSRLTEDVLGTVQEIGGDMTRPLAEYTHIMNEILLKLLVDWDLYEDEEFTIKQPIDEAHLKETPILFRAELINRIVGAFAPNAIGATQSESAPSSRTPMESVMEPRLGAS
jgi:hypothetical protein